MTPFNQNIFQIERSASSQQAQDFYETHMINFFGERNRTADFSKHFPKARISWRCDTPRKAYCRACLHTVYGLQEEKKFRRMTRRDFF